MKKNRNKRFEVFRKLLLTVLAFIILNGSTEIANSAPQKWNGDTYTEDLSYNDIESMYELMTECLLDLENCVPESDDHDDEQKTKLKKDWTVTQITVPLATFLPNIPCFPNYDTGLVHHAHELLCPPPDKVLQA